MRQVLRAAACSLKFETGARQRRLERLVRRSGALEERQDNSPGQGRRRVLRSFRAKAESADGGGWADSSYLTHGAVGFRSIRPCHDLALAQPDDFRSGRARKGCVASVMAYLNKNKATLSEKPADAKEGRAKPTKITCSH